MQTDQEEVVTQKTVRQAEPEAKGAAPQKVYETKKTIFRFKRKIKISCQIYEKNIIVF
jgi:hypothetical protein